MSAGEDLARRIESQAAIAAVPGQLADLEWIAREVRALGAEVGHRRAEARHYDDLASKALGELEQLRKWLKAVSNGRATREIHAQISQYLALGEMP